MKQGYTHISIVLDRSGSMESVKADTIGGFNAFLQQQKSAPGEATLTFAQFDNEYDLLADFAPISFVQLLTDRTYVPRGSTALLDAFATRLRQIVTFTRQIGWNRAIVVARRLWGIHSYQITCSAHQSLHRKSGKSSRGDDSHLRSGTSSQTSHIVSSLAR